MVDVSNLLLFLFLSMHKHKGLLDKAHDHALARDASQQLSFVCLYVAESEKGKRISNDPRKVSTMISRCELSMPSSNLNIPAFISSSCKLHIALHSLIILMSPST